MSYRIFVQHAVPIVIALVKDYLNQGDDSSPIDHEPTEPPVVDVEDSTDETSVIFAEQLVVLVSTDSDEA